MPTQREARPCALGAWGEVGVKEREREREERMHAGERVRERALWLLLLYVFSLHLGLPYANWA